MLNQIENPDVCIVKKCISGPKGNNGKPSTDIKVESCL